MKEDNTDDETWWKITFLTIVKVINKRLEGITSRMKLKSSVFAKRDNISQNNRKLLIHYSRI